MDDKIVYSIETVKAKLGKEKLGFVDIGTMPHMAEVIAEGFFIQHSFVHKRPRFRQILPFVIIYDGQKETVLGHKGTFGAVGKLSVGVSDHIYYTDPWSNLDIAGDQRVLNAAVGLLKREFSSISEEPMVPLVNALWHLGYVYDRTDAYHNCHLGVVYLLDVRRLTKVTSLSMFHPAVLLPLRDASIRNEKMGRWSKYCMDALFPAYGRRKSVQKVEK